MKCHRGNVLVSIMVAIALSTIPLLIISQCTSHVVALSVNENSYSISQRGISAAIYDMQRDIKSAIQMEATGDTLSLISDTNYIKYTWEDDVLYRASGGVTERVVSCITGNFTLSEKMVVVTYTLNGIEQSVCIYGEAME